MRQLRPYLAYSGLALAVLVFAHTPVFAQEEAESGTAETGVLQLRLTTDASGVIRSGTEVRARAQAIGVEADWEFEFQMLSPGSEDGYATIREFDANPSVVWVAEDTGGIYTLRALVRKAGASLHEPTAAVSTIMVEPRATGLLLALLGIFGVASLAGGGFAAVQFVFTPNLKRQRLSVIQAPPGMPTPHADLPVIGGLSLGDELTIGHGPDAGLNLRDTSISGIPCSVVRTRFGRRVRTFLEVKGTQEVQIDGAVVPPVRIPLTHMMRIHVGNYHLRFDAGELPPLLEVVYPDGRCERGDPSEFDFEGRPALSVLPQGGGPQHTIPFAAIEHVRVYRTVDQLQRLRRTAGSGTVQGPYARVRFQSGRMLRGRVETPDEIERGRFRIYTDELGGLSHILIIGDAVAAVRLDEGTADFHDEDAMIPRDSEESKAPRLKLGGPGPTAVSSQSGAVTEETPPDPDTRSMADRAKTAESQPKPQPPIERPDAADDAPRRYRDRRNRPRI